MTEFNTIRSLVIDYYSGRDARHEFGVGVDDNPFDYQTEHERFCAWDDGYVAEDIRIYNIMNGIIDE